jgi:hypothetical protein
MLARRLRVVSRGVVPEVECGSRLRTVSIDTIKKKVNKTR